MLGRVVTLEKVSNSKVTLLLDGSVIGSLNTTVGHEVASAIDRGQSFVAVIENAFPNYVDTGRPCGMGQFKQNGANLDIKVEYLLERGWPAIETEKCWRCVDAPEDPHPQTARSFLTKVAGVTFEGRQRIIARCSEGETLALLRDPHIRFDKGAIKVMRLNGEQIGFIPADVSRSGHSSGLAFRMDRGDQYRCRITNITGGSPGMSLGVNIQITDGEDDDVPQVPESKRAPDTSGARTLPPMVQSRTIVQPPFLWIFAVIIIGCILWVAFK